jgi:hypothetical protein
MSTTTTIGPGTRFRSVIQDCNALWEVTRRAGRSAWEAKCVNEPIEIDGRKVDSDYAGTVRAFTSAQIKQAARMEAFFARNMSDHDKFYAGLQLGQIIHYDNGFGQFVRCEVAIGTTVHDKKPHKCLKPIALVGDWGKYDLPRRMPDGSVHLGYHADKIVKGDCFEPNVSSIYEAKPTDRRGPVDPKTLPALDLSVPPMTDNEEATAKLWKAVEAARATLDSQGDRSTGPRARLEAAMAVIQGALG